jgi:hypothetical protein
MKVLERDEPRLHALPTRPVGLLHLPEVVMRAYLNAVLVLLLLSLPTLTMAEFTINGVYGPRSLDDPLWESIDGEDAFGLDVTWAKKTWPVRIAFAFSYFGDDNDEECIEYFSTFCPPELAGTVLERNMTELSAGVSHYWTPVKRLAVYAGGGLTSVDIEVESSALGFTEEDSSLAFYAQTGVLWVFPIQDSRSFLHLGIDLRYVTGTDFLVLGREPDADYFQIGLVFGGGMGPR